MKALNDYRLCLTCAVLLGISILTLAGVPASAAETDPVHEPSGASVAVACVACHGATGIPENPVYPILAGQHAAYLARQLKHFRNGERYHEMMTPVAQQLSDAEIDAVAVYYSEQLVPLFPDNEENEEETDQ